MKSFPLAPAAGLLNQSHDLLIGHAGRQADNTLSRRKALLKHRFKVDVFVPLCHTAIPINGIPLDRLAQ
ncbi:hypothetical protein [Pseudomonas amygdali]|uniref:hypothetical protein n=1 Tax=Pseudomonas amygdali TaxID=47877 RepID=UPI000AB1412F|nr:hypothetical protein [Pseudomonas amygdali]